MRYAAVLTVALGMAITSHAQSYRIDINDANTPVTEAGWTALNAAHSGSGSSVTIGGVTFTISSADGARLRGTVGSPTPDALLGDFVFDDGAGQAVGLLFGGAGDLQAGIWEVSVYIQDVNSPPGAQYILYRENGDEHIVASAVNATSSGPAITFRFLSDGVSAYDVFCRENGNDRSRLNGVELTYIGPVPAVAYRTTVLAQNPLAYYRMDTIDAEQGQTLTQNAIELAQSTPAPALASTGTPAFAGLGPSNSWANFAGDGTFLSGLVTGWSSDEGSISYWMRVDSDGDGTKTCLFARQTGGAGVFGGTFPHAIATFARPNGSYGVTFDGGSANQLDGGVNMLTVDEWHHFACTWKRNTGAGDGVIRIYLDGVEEVGLTDRSWSSFTLDEVQFGQEIGGTTRKFKGSADELAIWTRELTQQEILQQYWNGLQAYVEVAYAEGFQGYNASAGGSGQVLSGQNGWSGTGGVRNDLQDWTRMGGEWAYIGGSGQAAVNIGSFAGVGGIVTMDFCGRAGGKKSLYSLGYDDGMTYQPFVYFGVDGSNVRVMPYDGGGTSHNTTTGFTSSDTQLMRMRLTIDANSGTGSLSYYDRTAWQFPAALQDLDLYQHSARAASAPQRWNAVALNGDGGCWDSLHIVYAPPRETAFIFK